MKDIIVDRLFTSDDCKYLLSFASNFLPSGITLQKENVFNDYRLSEDCSVNNNPILNTFLLSKLSFLHPNYNVNRLHYFQQLLIKRLFLCTKKNIF